MDGNTAKLINATDMFVQRALELVDKKKFNATATFEIFSGLVETAEKIMPLAGRGALKHRMVTEAFSYFDRKYSLVKRLDDAIKLPWFLEPFDGKIIKLGIDLLISQAVNMMNRKLGSRLDLPLIVIEKSSEKPVRKRSPRKSTKGSKSKKTTSKESAPKKTTSKKSTPKKSADSESPPEGLAADK